MRRSFSCQRRGGEGEKAAICGHKSLISCRIIGRPGSIVSQPARLATQLWLASCIRETIKSLITSLLFSAYGFFIFLRTYLRVGMLCQLAQVSLLMNSSVNKVEYITCILIILICRIGTGTYQVRVSRLGITKQCQSHCLNFNCSNANKSRLSV